VPVNGLPQINATRSNVIDSYASGFTSGGIGVGLGDGSVRVITSDISNDTWCWACDPQNGFADPSDW
jgi:hypothetical protein